MLSPRWRQALVALLFDGLFFSRLLLLASAGGKSAHAYGLAHRFTPEQAREAGKKGGAKTAEDRAHMAEIGRKGGIAKGESYLFATVGKAPKESQA